MLEHGGHVIRAMPANPGDLGEQAAEANNRWFRNFREHHSFQCSKQKSLEHPFIRKMEMADPAILEQNKEFVLKWRPKPKPRPIEVISMMTASSKAKYMPNPATNVGDSSDSESDNGFDWNAPAGPADPQAGSLQSLRDALMEDDDDDNFIIIADDPGSSTDLEDIEESPSKRQKSD